MAQRVQVLYEDDLDGSKADGTVSFSFEDQSYEIDLSKKNQGKLRKAFQPYIEHGRRVRPGQRQEGRSTRKHSRSFNADVRQWAKIKGIEVKDRGRIPDALIAQFEGEVQSGRQR